MTAYGEKGWTQQEAAVRDELARRLGLTALAAVRDLSGGSGAQTMLCRTEGALGRPNAIIVKLGPEDLLAADLAGLRLASAYFREADFALDNATTVDGVTAIPLRVAGSDARTFEDEYRAAERPAQVCALIDELFNRVLRLPDLTTQPTNENAFEQYVIDDEMAMARRLRVVGDGVPGLVEWWRRARSAVRHGSYRRLCHGDLHGRNILIAGPDQRVYVIDFGQTREQHALRDLAKLEREIHLTMLGSAHAGRWTSGLLDDRSAEITQDADPELIKASAVVACIRAHARRHLPEPAGRFEYGIALLAQFMFAASNPALPMVTRRAALRAAHGIQRDVVAKYPETAFPEAEVRRVKRREVLWRFAYTFIRLDQLPGGCWTRTLHGWMTAMWAGDEGQIYRDPNMRRRGGTDLTCYTIDGLVRLLHQHLSTSDAARVFTDNEMLSRAFTGLRSKIGFQGGSGTAEAGNAHADVKIRHTAMTVLAVLRYRQGHDGAVGASEVLRSCLTYLATSLRYWTKDDAFTFGMAMACIKLNEVLGTRLVDHLNPALVDEVRAELVRVIPEMLEALENWPPNVAYLPPPKAVEVPRPPFFRPYCDFWRMERSGFLMYVSMAIKEDRQGLIEPIGPHLRRRFVQCFDELLNDVDPGDPEKPELSLVRFHRGGPRATRDWGLSAELAALLAVPAVADLIANGDQRRRAELRTKRQALEAALLATFDQFGRHPELFVYAQGAVILQAARALHGVIVTRDDLAALDASIDSLRNMHMTEWHVHTHVRDLIIRPADAAGCVDADSLRDLLVTKLEAGEYIELDAVWDQIADLAIDATALAIDATAIDGAADSVLVTAADDPVVVQLGATLATIAQPCRGLTISHAECPSYEGHLKRWGLSVDVLRLTDQTVVDAEGRVRSWRDIGPAEYDVVAAGGAVMGLPRHHMPALYESFFTALRSGGLMVVSIREKDHALIDTSGRFVQYYRDHTGLQALLAEIGFEIMQVTQSAQPHRPGKRPCTWAHLLCRKPKEPAPAAQPRRAA